MSGKTCPTCRRRAAERYEAAMGRRRGVVASLVAAALLVLVTGMWAAGVTGDAGIGVAGVGLALGVLWLAFEAEGEGG